MIRSSTTSPGSPLANVNTSYLTLLSASSLIASSNVFAPEIPPISVASINPVCGFTVVLVPKIFAILFCEAFN